MVFVTPLCLEQLCIFLIQNAELQFSWLPHLFSLVYQNLPVQIWKQKTVDVKVKHSIWGVEVINCRERLPKGDSKPSFTSTSLMEIELLCSEVSVGSEAGLQAWHWLNSWTPHSPPQLSRCLFPHHHLHCTCTFPQENAAQTVLHLLIRIAVTN